jgi:acetyl esterase/lipase
MTVTTRDETLVLDAVQLGVRIYAGRPVLLDTPLILHLHAGAFVSGSLDMGRTVSTLLAEAGAIVISADYPLAPQSVFPQTLQTLFQALTLIWQKRGKWAGRKSQVYVAGEEAGGNLAAGLALMARDQRSPALAGQILLAPMLDACLATESVRLAEAGPVGCKWADGWHQYLGTADKACHPYAVPLGSSRLGGLAPALIVTAEDDPMRDESLAYARRLRASAVAVREHVLPGPTDWPCALAEADGLKAGWAGALREHFTEFLAGTASLLCPASSPGPMKARQT